ncbi:MAG: hypothetical protein JW940_02740 [Polyangiaceae bacterium]|nr:hypothetical protein [Polyangiaceae bacterium]
MLRPKTATALTAGGLVLATAGGCGKNAVGVDTCRDIEYARCEAAPSCPKLFDVSDVEQCKRFYRDQCLHGLAASEEPGAPKVRACVQAIVQAGRCAKQDKSLAECGSLLVESTDAKNACDLIGSPEKLDACAFLEPEDEPDSNDNKGSAGQPGTTGSSGASGAKGSD